MLTDAAVNTNIKAGANHTRRRRGRDILFHYHRAGKSRNRGEGNGKSKILVKVTFLIGGQGAGFSTLVMWNKTFFLKIVYPPNDRPNGSVYAVLRGRKGHCSKLRFDFGVRASILTSRGTHRSIRRDMP